MQVNLEATLTDHEETVAAVNGLTFEQNHLTETCHRLNAFISEFTNRGLAAVCFLPGRESLPLTIDEIGENHQAIKCIMGSCATFPCSISSN